MSKFAVGAFGTESTNVEWASHLLDMLVLASRAYRGKGGERRWKKEGGLFEKKKKKKEEKRREKRSFFSFHPYHVDRILD